MIMRKHMRNYYGNKPIDYFEAIMLGLLLLAVIVVCGYGCIELVVDAGHRIIH
jgi:hypothetical protein